jgi:tryptophan-specific transport protein
MTANLGVLERGELETIAKSGGGVAQLSAALQSHTSVSNLPLILSLFSHLAITTSFLGISLSLFDFIADRFQYENTRLGRSKTAIVTFTPPAVLSVLAPTGFVLAIGYAGLAVLFSFFIVPGLMAKKRGLLRSPALIVIIVFSGTAAVVKLAYS